MLTRTPNRFQPDTPLPDNLALLNDNFDVLDGLDQLLVYTSGTATIHCPLPTTDGSSFSTTVSHNLPFVPAYIAYMYNPNLNTYSQLPYLSMQHSAVTGVVGLVGEQYIYAETTANTIKFTAQFGYAGIPYTNFDILIRYYLLQEKGAVT